MDSIELTKRKCIFIDGPGGTGKTTVIKKLIAKALAQGKLVKVCASTTLAATLYENATTAHENATRSMHFILYALAILLCVAPN